MNVARPPSALNALRPPDNRPGARFRARTVLVAVAVIFFAVLTTEPRVPYEWDAAAWWIPRAEMEREHSGRLLAMMRMPEEWGLLLPGIGTHVYPIAYPMVVGALARLLPEKVSALRASGAWLALLVAVLLVQIGRRLDDTDGALAVLPLALVLLSPFTIVHARSGYADLSVGLLGALLVLAMDTAFDRATMTRLVWMVLRIDGPSPDEAGRAGHLHGRRRFGCGRAAPPDVNILAGDDPRALRHHRECCRVVGARALAVWPSDSAHISGTGQVRSPREHDVR